MAVPVPEIIGRNYEVSPEVRNLLETKLNRLEQRLFEDVISVRVVLQVEKYRNICEIVIAGRNNDVRTIQESDESMVDAINGALDHAKRQARKHHEKFHDHHKSDADESSAEPPAR